MSGILKELVFGVAFLKGVVATGFLSSTAERIDVKRGGAEVELEEALLEPKMLFQVVGFTGSCLPLSAEV